MIESPLPGIVAAFFIIGICCSNVWLVMHKWKVQHSMGIIQTA